MIKQQPSPNFYKGRSQKVKVIILHWWGDPKDKPTFAGVVKFLRTASTQVSAHYVVSDTKVSQLVKESDTAWHARHANPFSIGIEIDPRTPGKTYETVAKLVKEIRKRHGNIPLKKHSDYVATKCPGTINLKKIDKLAKENGMFKGKGAKHWWKKFQDMIDKRNFWRKKANNKSKKLSNANSALKESQKIAEKLSKRPKQEEVDELKKQLETVLKDKKKADKQAENAEDNFINRLVEAFKDFLNSLRS